MLRYRLLFAGPIIAMVFFMSGISSAGYAVPYSTTINVKIAADKSIKGQVESFINREIRSLHDVEIIDERANWELHINARELKTKQEDKIAIVIAISYIYNFDNQVLSNMFHEEWKEPGLKVTEKLFSYIQSHLFSGPPDSLRKLCTDIVADFDNDHLEPLRKRHRSMMKQREDQ